MLRLEKEGLHGEVLSKSKTGVCVLHAVEIAWGCKHSDFDVGAEICWLRDTLTQKLVVMEDHSGERFGKNVDLWILEQAVLQDTGHRVRLSTAL